MKHGESSKRITPEYRVWKNMLARCYGVNRSDYPTYGGRGVIVHLSWRHNYLQFLHDMGRRPEGTSIDRYPNKDGNYEPNNCRWATQKQQNWNKRPYARKRCSNGHIYIPETTFYRPPKLHVRRCLVC